MTSGFAAAIVMPPLAPLLTRLWHLLFDLQELQPGRWTLVGGQMVALHGLEHGRTDVRPSADGDVVVDIRVVPGALREIVAFLTDRDFVPDPSADGLLHRFTLKSSVDGDLEVDVLAPDHMGVRADLTTIPPGRTVEVPGGSQALQRTEVVAMIVDGRPGTVPRPTLVGALLIKLGAVNLPGDARRHEADIAFLLSCMRDPRAARTDLSRSELSRLRACALNDPEHRAWVTLPRDRALQGLAALALLTGTPG